MLVQSRPSAPPAAPFPWYKAAVGSTCSYPEAFPPCTHALCWASNVTEGNRSLQEDGGRPVLGVGAGTRTLPSAAPARPRRQPAQRAEPGCAALDLEREPWPECSQLQPRGKWANPDVPAAASVSPSAHWGRGELAQKVFKEVPSQLHDSTRAAPNSLSPRASSSAFPGCQELAPGRLTARPPARPR